MNILVISHEYPPIGGGGANACFFLSREYVRQGHSVTVVTSSYKNLPSDEIQDGVKIIRVKAKRTKEDKSTFLEMFSYLKSAYFFVDRLVEKEHFDVCQVFFGIPSGPIGVHLKKKYKIPYVVRFGGGDIPGAQKRFALMYKVLSPFIRNIWKNADALVANSEVLKERAMSYEDRYQIDIIPNGVDSDFFTRDISKRQHNLDVVNILFVSRLIKGKGLQHIIPHLSEIYDKVKVHLTIVGDGPYKEELENITSESKQTEYVTFVGKKNKTELWDYYNDADLFILPSESEGMPNVVLEAMSMELPIVMTPCGGSKELIDGNGIVSDIDGFMDSLSQVCKDVEKRKEMSVISRKRACELFSWQQKANQYICIFSRVINNQ